MFKNIFNSIALLLNEHKLNFEQDRKNHPVFCCDCWHSRENNTGTHCKKNPKRLDYSNEETLSNLSAANPDQRLLFVSCAETRSLKYDHVCGPYGRGFSTSWN